MFSLIFGMGLLAMAFASDKDDMVEAYSTLTKETNRKGGWNEKLTCQKSFSGQLTDEMMAADVLCSYAHPPTHQVCRYSCMAGILDLVATNSINENDSIFNMDTMKLMLDGHLTKGGDADKARLQKQLKSCMKHLHLLKKPCDEQSELWDCVDTAMTCE